MIGLLCVEIYDAGVFNRMEELTTAIIVNLDAYSGWTCLFTVIIGDVVAGRAD